MSEALLDKRTTVEIENPTFRAIVQEGGISELPGYIEEELGASRRAFIITDSNVVEHYGGPVADALDRANIPNQMLIMPAGEEHKRLFETAELWTNLSNYGANRNDIIIALGGGVVGDLGGFVAATYNRSVPVVQVPTTVLAMVDSSIGGKTGIDHAGKNKVGAFYQPKLIVADPNTLGTLSERVYTEGFGEIAKYGILDDEFLPTLEEQASSLRKFSPDTVRVLGRIITYCVKRKSDIIAYDPLEQKPDGRNLLNYGHTLGHGLEAAGGFEELLHGEGVAIGMMYAAKLALEQGVTESGDLLVRQTTLLETLGLPTKYSGEADLETILSYMKKDKKNTGGETIPFILPKRIGYMAVHPVRFGDVQDSLREFLAA